MVLIRDMQPIKIGQMEFIAISNIYIINYKKILLFFTFYCMIERQEMRKRKKLAKQEERKGLKHEKRNHNCYHCHAYHGNLFDGK